MSFIASNSGGGGGAGGDVVGPASSTDNAVVRYDSTTGKLIQDSGVTIDDSNNLLAPGDLRAGTAGVLRLTPTAACGFPGIDFNRTAAASADRKTLTYSAGGLGVYLRSGNGDLYVGFNTDTTGSGGRLTLYGTQANIAWATDGVGDIGGTFAAQRPRSIRMTGAIHTASSAEALTADDQTISPTHRGYIKITSNSATATDRTFSLGNGSMDGQMLILQWNTAVASGAGELPNDTANNVRLSAAWTPDIYDTLTLIWDATDGNWIELHRSTN